MGGEPEVSGTASMLDEDGTDGYGESADRSYMEEKFGDSTEKEYDERLARIFADEPPVTHPDKSMDNAQGDDHPAPKQTEAKEQSIHVNAKEICQGPSKVGAKAAQHPSTEGFNSEAAWMSRVETLTKH